MRNVQLLQGCTLYLGESNSERRSSWDKHVSINLICIYQRHMVIIWSQSTYRKVFTENFLDVTLLFIEHMTSRSNHLDVVFPVSQLFLHRGQFLGVVFIRLNISTPRTNSFFRQYRTDTLKSDPTHQPDYSGFTRDSNPWFRNFLT